MLMCCFLRQSTVGTPARPCSTPAASALAAGAFALLSAAGVAQAQWQSDYSIQRLGFFGPGYVGSAGYSHSTVFGVTPSGRVCGTSQRVSLASTDQGQAVWTYNPVTGVTSLIALTQELVYSFHAIDFQTSSGQVAGRYLPLASGNVPLGARTWVYTPGSQPSVLRTGLFSAGFFYVPDGLAPSEYAFSQNQLFNEAGWIAGASKRFEANGVENGVGVWVFNPVTRTTVRTGLFDGPHSLVGNFQTSEIRAMTPAGQVVGVSARRQDALVGQSVWVHLPSAIGTTLLGDPSGSQRLIQDVDFQNDAGHIALRSFTPVSQTAPEAQTTFAFDPIAGTVHRTGLFGAGYGTLSTEFSASAFQNAAGHTTGISRKFAGPAELGQNPWFYDAVTHTSTAIGLTSAAYTGVAGPSSGGGGGGGPVIPAGYQFGEPRGIDSAGRVAGISARIIGADTHNGQNTWLYNPASNTTVQIGLGIGPGSAAYIGSAGYQFSDVLQQNQVTGRVIGYTRRISGVDIEIGQNLWVHDPASQQTVQTGLSGPPWRGSSGSQFTGLDYANAAGQVAGHTKRYTGVNTEQGQNTWALRPGPQGAVQTGLTTAAHTSGSYQFSQNLAMDEAGRIVGLSQRLDALGMENGQNIWVYNPATNTTIQTGLTAATYTGSGGYQLSDYAASNAAGQVVGISQRITGVSTVSGNQDVWYFDPATGVTHAIVGTPQGSRTLAEVAVLTEDGTLFGRYYVFSGPQDSGTPRAFAFRPDRGFADLGSLVNGGLAASGWSALQTPAIATSVNQVVGIGLANVGTAQAPVAQPGGQSVFVMTKGCSCLSIANVAGFGGTPGCDGAITVDDLVYFLSQFFARNQNVADVVGFGGDAGPDGQITVDDLVAFLAAFFGGCQ